MFAMRPTDAKKWFAIMREAKLGGCSATVECGPNAGMDLAHDTARAVKGGIANAAKPCKLPFASTGG